MILCRHVGYFEILKKFVFDFQAKSAIYEWRRFREKHMFL